MTTQEIYRLAVLLGVKADLRGEDRVKKYLSRIKEKYNRLEKAEQQEFDQEKLTNPYADTRVLVDNQKSAVNKIMVGIDIDGQELLLADRLGDIDLVISHHPTGKALANLHRVMDLQSQVLANYGVPINVAEGINKARIAEVGRKVAPINHNRSVDIAKILQLDLMTTHTIADNLAAKYVIKAISYHQEKLETVGDVIKLLKQIPEYKQAIKYSAGPKIFVGDKENSCGRIAVTEFTGGTSGAKEIYKRMSQVGIGTIISMYMGEEYREEAQKHHLNVVVAGHMASDSLGMNLFLDELEKQGIEIIPVAGLIRIKRFK